MIAVLACWQATKPGAGAILRRGRAWMYAKDARSARAPQSLGEPRTHPLMFPDSWLQIGHPDTTPKPHRSRPHQDNEDEWEEPRPILRKRRGEQTRTPAGSAGRRCELRKAAGQRPGGACVDRRILDGAERNPPTFWLVISTSAEWSRRSWTRGCLGTQRIAGHATQMWRLPVGRPWSCAMSWPVTGRAVVGTSVARSSSTVPACRWCRPALPRRPASP